MALNFLTNRRHGFKAVSQSSPSTTVCIISFSIFCFFFYVVVNSWTCSDTIAAQSKSLALTRLRARASASSTSERIVTKPMHTHACAHTRSRVYMRRLDEGEDTIDVWCRQPAAIRPRWRSPSACRHTPVHSVHALTSICRSHLRLSPGITPQPPFAQLPTP